MAIDYQTDLNEQQYAVVTADDGPVLVIAAAGTGKTRALTYRVAWLIEERQVAPHRILLLTFTNKAAREMLERATALAGEGVGGLWGGTFHHMANRLLRRHGNVLGYERDFAILDADDSRGLIRQCMDECNLSPKEFARPEVLASIFSLAANREADVQAIAEERFGEHSPKLDDVLRVQRRYTKQKRETNAMDFDDLLVNGLRLFQEDRDLLARYQEHFMYILVDEYQDTNIIQAAWVDSLAARRRNLLAVGDDFQSIYAWRGADYRNIMRFGERYEDATLYKLEINYRSVPEILDVANTCIAGNPDQYQKTLRPMRESHRRPVLARMRDGGEQANFVVERIGQWRRQGIAERDMAILYRAHFHALEIQLALTRAGIAYHITSGLRFFEQAHIKDVTAILRLLVQPRDRLAFLRLLCLFPRMGQRTAAKVWDRIGGELNAREPEALASLRQALPPGAQGPWEPVHETLSAVVPDNLFDDPGEVIHRFVKGFYEAYAKQTFENDTQRLQDIAELVDFASRYDTTHAFVQEMALLTNLDGHAGEKDETDDAVRMSTIHQAKGLEWTAVIVPWLADGMFPSSRSLQEGEGEAEERRLFYVAATRAKDELVLSVPQCRITRDGGMNFLTVSRFIEELPADLLERDELAVW